jgi:hypothetical protein
MPYVVEVDQSGRIEFTSHDTVLAFSDGESFSVLIPASVKRACITELRSRGLSGPTLYVRLFATGLYSLLKKHIQKLSRVTIDVEYLGKEAQIEEHLINLFRRAKHKVDAEQIQFRLIGKKSSAHLLALDTLSSSSALSRPKVSPYSLRPGRLPLSRYEWNLGPRNQRPLGGGVAATA